MFKKKIFNLFVFPFFASLICVLNIHFCEVKNEKKYDLQLPVEPMTLDGGVLFSWQLCVGGTITFDNFVSTSANTATCRISSMYLPTDTDLNIDQFNYDGIDWTVNIIKNSAFANVSTLRGVYIPRSVTSMNEGAFANCTNLVTVNFSPACQLTNIGTNSDTIGMFENCSSLTNFLIPQTINIIGKNAFKNNVNLDRISIPKSVSIIGFGSFSGCNSINSIFFPTSNNNLTTIDDEAFQGCTQLTQINISNIPGTIFTRIGKSAFKNCINLQNANLSLSSLNIIDDSAFEGCSTLQNLNISNATNITKIGDSAFKNCTSLQNVDLSKITTNFTLGEFAFSNTQIINIKLANSLTTIGDKAFSNCSSLEEITIFNSNVTCWDNTNDLFENSPLLVSIYVPYDSVTNYQSNVPTQYVDKIFAIKMSTISIIGSQTIDDNIADFYQYNANVNFGADPSNVSWSIANDSTNYIVVDTTGKVTWNGINNGRFIFSIVATSTVTQNLSTSLLVTLTVRHSIPTSLVITGGQSNINGRLFETLAPTEKYICKTDKGDVVSDPVFSYTGELPNGIEFNPSNGRMYGTPLELDILGTEITISVSSPSFPDLTSNIKKTDIYIDYPLPIPQPPANLLLIFTTTGILILLIVLAVVLLFWIL